MFLTQAVESTTNQKKKQSFEIEMTTKNVEDLLIFGYACKIFRDDEKALHIDQGRHLIPWMGDNTLKIDRYDVRAALTDISKYEPPPGGYENRLDYLSADEQRAEQLCEEERYYSLYNNDFEEELYKEEKLKRLKSGYGQVGFNYIHSSNRTSNDVAGTTNPESGPKDEQPDEAYVPHPKFYIPPNMEMPETTKLQAIIGKTARFISTQGAQMEILIKAKQANNPSFDFLNQSGRLNPFYKHTLQAMKDGNYPVDTERQENSSSLSSKESSESIYQNYYSSNKQVPVTKYKPSADCAYTQLISKIKGVPILSEATSNYEDKAPSLVHRQNQINQKNQSENSVEVKQISTGLMLAQYYNSDSDDEEDDDSNSSKILSSGFQNEPIAGNSSIQSNENAEVPVGILVPPPELRVIIDKTALYVLKNGKDFEDILREKNDERFTFLRYKDPYYKYYTYKVTGIVCPDPIQVTVERSARLGNVKETQDYNYDVKTSENNKPMVPVSFSIKSKDDAIPTVLKPALSLEQSSDEEMQQTENNTDKTIQNIVCTSQQTNQIQSKPPNNNDDSHNQSADVEQSESFIRDTILEQQNRDEKRQIKRAEDKVKDRLAQLAREKLGILSKEKQLQLERKKRAMAFINQINGDENAETKIAEKTEIALYTTNEMSSEKMKNEIENGSEHSDSSDSVKFVMTSSSTTICAAAKQTIHKNRNISMNQNSSESDDVIEITPRDSRSNSRQRSRSKSSSSRRYHQKSKHSKKQSKKRRSRSRSNRYSRSSSRDYKRKRSSASKTRKYR